MAEMLTSREKSVSSNTTTTCRRAYRRVTNGVPGNEVLLAPVVYDSGKHSWSTQGYNIPHFHARQRKGELLPQTPFYQVKVDGSTTSSYDMNYYVTSTVYDHYYVSVGSYLPFNRWIVSIDDVEALTPVADKRFVQAAAAAIYTNNGFDALTFIAELASVKDMFLSLGKQLITKRFPRTKRELANNWLQGRYGWRPLYGDVVNLHQAIQNFNDRRTRYSERKGYKDSYTSGTSWVTGSGTNNELWFTETNLISYGITGCVTADIAVPSFQFNPVRTAWELVPYSFVLDWFVSVGEAISVASFLTLQNAYSASTGTMAEIERTYEAKHPSTFTCSHPPWGHFCQTGTSKVRIERRIPCNVPLTPHTNLNLNPYKVIDLVGMVIQKRKGG